MAPMTAWLIRQAGLLHIPTVVICHNVMPHERNWFDAVLARWTLGKADHLFVHNLDDQVLAHRLLPHSHVERVSLPSYQVFDLSTWTREKAHATLNIEGNVALFFGIVRPYKGLGDLLNALPFILSEIPLTLLIVGEFWESLEKYQRQIKELGLESQVRVIDQYVSNAQAAMYFSAADLVVLPYRHATGSAVLQLAFSLGVPVVASRVGSMAEEVQDGENGFLVNSGNPEELANAIVRFFRGQYAASFRSAIAQNRARFEWSVLIDKLSEPITNQRSKLEIQSKCK
ncbi:MAG: glycosyltransferase [Chloroflexi bacterium]|nr:glycosyltransferase [Chloroflexota bacterium]